MGLAKVDSRPRMNRATATVRQYNTATENKKRKTRTRCGVVARPIGSCLDGDDCSDTWARPTNSSANEY